MYLQNRIFKGVQRAIYNLAMVQNPQAKTFLEKHQIATDAVFAHSLAVPGLDLYAIRPGYVGSGSWDGGGRIRAFAQALKSGITLRPSWAINLNDALRPPVQK